LPKDFLFLKQMPQVIPALVKFKTPCNYCKIQV